MNYAFDTGGVDSLLVPCDTLYTFSLPGFQSARAALIADTCESVGVGYPSRQTDP